MLTINGIQLDFDITSPSDVMRYRSACERIEQTSKGISLPQMPEDDPGFLDAYVAMLNDELRAYGNFIDDVFGAGVAEQLLGNNPSLNKVDQVNEALNEAMDAHATEFGVKMQKYKPNRATRRAKPAQRGRK